MNSITCVTYNLLCSRAVDHAATIIKMHHPDFFAVQELADDPVQIEKLGSLTEHDRGMVCAATAPSFSKKGRRFVNGLFYRADRFACEVVYTVRLPQSKSERLQVMLQGLHNTRSAIVAEFVHRRTGKRLMVCTLHLNLVGTTRLRLRQLTKAIARIDDAMPLIVCGDCNFYRKRALLEVFLRDHALEEATASIDYTFSYRFAGKTVFRNKIDYVFYRHLDHHKTERLDETTSDHFPILSRLRFRE